jgi:prepilin-type N-terminal cleavage/methylation domain-containing protein
MKNNKGMSLVELLVAVSILSIIMIGIGFVLSAMSKNFATSQKEVQLQDSVQTVYSVVSELIQEAQCDDKGETSVLYSTNGDETHIVVLNKVYKVDSSTSKSEVDTSLSKLYAIGLNKNVLYLKEFSLYTGDKELDYATRIDVFNDEGTTTKANDFNWHKDVYQDECILSQNVESISIDSTNYSNGYVVLSLELKSGTRSADITQNVYLRNSNTAVLATVEKDTETVATPSPTPVNKKLVKISGKNYPSSYYAGDIPILSDFSFTGTYDDGTTGQLSASEYSCDQIDGVAIAESLIGKKISFTFDFASGASLESITIEVPVKERTSGGTFVLPVASVYNKYQSGNSSYYEYNVSTNDDVVVYGYANIEYGTKTVTKTDIEYYDIKCGDSSCPRYGQLMDDSWFGSYWSGDYHVVCQGNWQPYTIGSSSAGIDETIATTTLSYKTRQVTETSEVTDYNSIKTIIGQIRIQNESTSDDYTGVEVIVYFQDGVTTFDRGSVEIISGSDMSDCSYSFSGDNKYMYIYIPSMNKATSSTTNNVTTNNYDTYVLTYKWTNSTGKVPVLATYSIKSANNPLLAE